MPEQDGMEVILELTWIDARVIAMTGASGEQKFLSVAKLFGARHILEKPFGADQIRRLVNYTLAH
jgi:two-component system response regulator (stage 0 sporulation protein F)